MNEYDNLRLADWEQKQDYLNGFTMMTEYEKAMLCHYLINLIDFMEIDKPKFENFYKTIIRLLGINEAKFPSYVNQVTKDYKMGLKFKEELKQLLKQHIIIFKYRNHEIEKRLKIIFQLYSLDKIESEFIKYYVHKIIIPLVGEINEYFDSTFTEFEVFGVQCLHLKSWVVLRIRRNLLNKGLFYKRGMNNEKIFLNNKIIQIFSDPNIQTKTQIKNTLLGKNQKSELCWKDFEHIENERDIAFNILTSAVQTQAKGINILLYGSVGTGKTQLAKLLANKAKIDMYAVSAEFMDKEASRKERLGDLSSKQTILTKTNNSCILFDEAEDVMNRGFTEFGSASKAYLNTLLEETPVPIFWTTNNIYTVDPAFLRRMTYTIEFEKLSDDIRLNIWKKVVRKNKLKVNKEKLVELNKIMTFRRR